MTKIYVGRYPQPHVNVVEVRDLETGGVGNLDAYLNLTGENEGPGTFTWGYGDKRSENDSYAPGPLRLSYALLCDSVGKTAADKHAGVFLQRFVSKLPEEGSWAISDTAIHALLDVS